MTDDGVRGLYSGDGDKLACTPIFCVGVGFPIDTVGELCWLLSWVIGRYNLWPTDEVDGPELNWLSTMVGS